MYYLGAMAMKEYPVISRAGASQSDAYYCHTQDTYFRKVES